MIGLRAECGAGIEVPSTGAASAEGERGRVHGRVGRLLAGRLAWIAKFLALAPAREEMLTSQEMSVLEGLIGELSGKMEKVVP